MNRLPVQLLAFFICVSLVLAVGGCSSDGRFRHCDGSVWATSYHITYRASSALDDSVIQVMNDIEKSLSPFLQSSLVSAINRSETDSVDAYICEVFEASKSVNSFSAGVFDPTVHPLVELWGFGRNRDVREPSQSRIDSALLVVGLNKCSISNGRIVKPSPLTSFDFSAITKGYATDKIGAMFRRNGVDDYMIEIGGDVALGGRNARGALWRIMIEAPVDNDTTASRERLSIIELTDCGIATSGNYRNFHDFDSGRMGHTISPVTGRPIATSTLSATVIAPTAMLADAFATACMAMPSADALAMIESQPATEALIVVADTATTAAGRWKILKTAGFPTLQ